MSLAIQNKAMLVTLSISQWTARKQDKSVTAEVETAHGAHDSGKFNKLLVAKELLEPITKLTAKIRESHHFSTRLHRAVSGVQRSVRESCRRHAGEIPNRSASCSQSLGQHVQPW